MTKLKTLEEEIGVDRAEIDKNLHILDDREQDIIEFCYGSADVEGHTAAVAAAIFDISKDRVRQLRLRALGKLNYHVHFQGKNLSGGNIFGTTDQPRKNYRSTAESALLMLINAEVAEYVDDLPCKAEVLKSQAILMLFQLLEPNLNDVQMAQIDRLKQQI
jgi:Sigma-70, region 4